ISNVKTLTTAAGNYFNYIDFEGVGGPNAVVNGANNLSGIRSSTITPTYAYNTVNHPIIPTRGLRVNLSFGFTGSVLGGNVNTLQPALDIAYFRRGIWKRNIMGFHVNGRFIIGYGGKVAPPYLRYYMGGENDIRGFDLLTISPFAYLPTTASVPVLNKDGTPVVQKIVNADGSIGTSAVTTTVPSYQVIFPGGDTAGVFNYEYRIPIVGPVTLAPFLDVGVDRLSFPSQLGLDPSRLEYLNALFPQANFSQHAIIAAGTQKPRASVGLELQVLMPVVNAPFRLYWAYNLRYLDTTLTPPVVADPSFFPNTATFQSAVQNYLGAPFRWDERRSIFRFSIGRTF
ncbi:MAG: BamA/TamA family outer membrane protein, partial [Acidobacteriaceae bacterium]|nr:BamA/TamA family outer membrane protein [Acidobacteriaceae bacterium]